MLEKAEPMPKSRLAAGPRRWNWVAGWIRQLML
jgi:hypothetical protein